MKYDRIKMWRYFYPTLKTANCLSSRGKLSVVQKRWLHWSVVNLENILWRHRCNFVLHLGMKTVGIYPVPSRTIFYIWSAQIRIIGQNQNRYEIQYVKFENGMQIFTDGIYIQASTHELCHFLFRPKKWKLHAYCKLLESKSRWISRTWFRIRTSSSFKSYL